MKSKFFLLSFILFTGWVFAGEVEKPFEVTVYSGVFFAADTLKFSEVCPSPFSCAGTQLNSRISVNNSPLFGLGVGYYFTKNFELEGNFAIAPAHDIHSSINSIPGPSLNLVAYNYDANVVYNFDWKGMRPFLSGGMGAITRDNSFDVTTDFTYNFGIGAKFYYKNLGLRLELKDQIMPNLVQPDKKKNVLGIQSGIFFSF